jgi:hypothetical protein
MPAVKAESDSPSEPPTPVSASSSKPRPSFPAGSFSQQQISQQKQIPMSTYNHNMGSFNNAQHYGPFSTALPAESQMMLGSTFNMNDPYMNMMMAGSDNFSGNNWNFDVQLPSTSDTVKQPQSHPSLNGLNSTLAPAAHDMNSQSDSSQSFFDDAIKASNGNETLAGTPGINGESWVASSTLISGISLHHSSHRHPHDVQAASTCTLSHLPSFLEFNGWISNDTSI